VTPARHAVAIGGGTGQPNVLRCLLALGYDTTAIVTVADDGGSSGQLRRTLGMLPPGDARNCLVAMADPDSPQGRLFQYRFPEGEGLAGHALGNLIIAALTDIEGSFPAALADAARLLRAQGTVLPSTLDDVVLVAEDVEGVRVVGQSAVTDTDTPLVSVRYVGKVPEAYPPAVDAVRDADLVVVGPGSLFTSILPNFLVRGMGDALRACDGTVAFVCNVVNQRGETGGMDALAHVRALLDHGLTDAIDVVVVHDSDAFPLPGEYEQVEAGADVARQIAELGMKVVAADLADPDDAGHHSHEALLAVLKEVG
jgi:uncharacterized cofD-like protein